MVLTLVGYPLVAVIGVAVGTRLSVPFRVVVDVIAAAALFVAFMRKIRFWIDVPIVLFLGLYLMRLVFDMNRPDMLTVGADTLFYLSTCLIPVVAATPLAGRWNPRWTGLWLVAVGTLASVATLVVQFSGIGGKQSMTELTGRLSFDTVNPITFGHIGVTTLLAVMATWSGSDRLRRILLAAACVPAAVVLVLANSRSPFLSLIAAVLVLLVARRRWLVLAGGLVVLAVGLLFADNISDLLYGSRLVTIQDAASIERLITQNNAIHEFSEHPIFGSGYVDPITQNYPHNLFIDAAISLGVVGLGLYIWITLQAVTRSYFAIRRGELLAPLLFWQFLILGQLSSTFFGAGALFLTMVILSANRERAAKSGI